MRAYVRVEDVLESTRAAEDALRRSANEARDARDASDAARDARRARDARATVDGEDAVRMLAREREENARLSEECARLGKELRARGTGTTTTTRDEEEEEEALDETVKELFDLVESERRARRDLEEKLSEYERGVGEARDEDATRRAEEAEETVREQEKKLSQAADIIGELRTALLQVMETDNRGGAPGIDDDEFAAGWRRAERRRDAVGANDGGGEVMGR